jgi:outer membrane immunogenic protein
MKRILLATTALAFAGPVFAADLSPARMPLKAPPVIARPFSWTGCYVGGHLGGAWGHANFTDPNNVRGTGDGYFAPTGGSVDFDQGAGVLGGGQIGCDYQFATNWVVGLAGDFSWTSLDGNVSDPFSSDPLFAGKNGGPITLHDRTEWLATATGRVGYAWDHWLLYGKGGVAWQHSRDSVGNLFAWGNPGFLCLNSNFTAFLACNPSGTDTQAGWTVGLGLEWAFANNWSVGIEYDHYGFGSHSVTLTDTNVPAVLSGPSAPITVSQRIDAVKVILDYHFGWLAR